MSKWQPISALELLEEISKGIKKMSPEQLIVWKEIEVEPQKWDEEEFGNLGGGFWVVAIDQNEIIWYNDIEEGFNVSTYSSIGTIENYSAEQAELHWALEKLDRRKRE